MDRMVSIIGSGYLQPIATLLEKLFSRDLQLDDVKAGHFENGYSASICLLSVIWFESYSVRVRYINKNNPFSKNKNPIWLLSGLYADFPYLDQLTEVYIVRDLIAHNHLWHIDFEYSDLDSNDTSLELVNAEKDQFGGDEKYNKYVDSISRKTKTLGLNAVPIRVNRRDVCKVLRVLWESLCFLERKNIKQCAVSISQVVFEGKRIKLENLINELENRLS